MATTGLLLSDFLGRCNSGWRERSNVPTTNICGESLPGCSGVRGREPGSRGVVYFFRSSLTSMSWHLDHPHDDTNAADLLAPSPLLYRPEAPPIRPEHAIRRRASVRRKRRLVTSQLDASIAAGTSTKNLSKCPNSKHDSVEFRHRTSPEHAAPERRGRIYSGRHEILMSNAGIERTTQHSSRPRCDFGGVHRTMARRCHP